MNKVANVFALVFIYFFVSIGLVVIFNTLIAALSKMNKIETLWIRLGVNLAVGLVLSLIATMAVSAYNTESGEPYYSYTSSPWLLPTVMFALGILVLLNNVKLSGGKKPM